MTKDVYSADCSFFHPDDVIKDHVVDGQSITVELYTGIPLIIMAFPNYRIGPSLPVVMENTRGEKGALRPRET